MKLFITGGSGFVGGHIVEHFAKTHEVYAMARSETAKQAVEHYGAQAVNCCLETVSARHLEGMDAVIHVAGYAEPWGPKQAFYKMNVEGTQNMLRAAQQASVKRFINMSTDSVVFEPGNQIDLTEDMPLIESSPYAYCETKMLAEKLVTSANSDKMKTLSLRPTLIWGPRDTSILKVIKDMARRGMFVLLGDGQHLISTCHVYNLVHGVEAALNSELGGEAYFIKDDHDLTIKEWYRYLAKLAEIPVPTRSMPVWLAKAFANSCDWIWRTFKFKSEPPITPFAVALMSSSLTLSTEKLKKQLAWQPVITREQGIAQMFPDNPTV
ncbi:MAG: NAD-dependent epimerase/dehydratase family protein [Coxiellaceae bacterium]|nr:NAD-dependent epimerase/dehydratase family protein [Coxiellaceae bacterium]